MAASRLFRPGPFLLGLTLILFGALVFGIAFVLPQASTPEGTAANFELLGQIGGGMGGVGLVAMVIGLLRNRG
jgi:hypothetical protein